MTEQLQAVVLTLTVEGEPTTKARPRMGRRGTYTPDKTVQAEHAIGWAARAELKAQKPNEMDELRVEISFYSSTRQRRDIDNMAKLVLDALNGIAWRDDAQIAVLNLRRGFDAGRPRTEIGVYVELSRARDCAKCAKPLTAKQITQAQEFCSKGCYDEAQRAGHYRMCAGCGSPILRRESTVGERTVYCSSDCEETQAGLCRVCSAPVAGPEARFCSSSCRRTWYTAQSLSGRAGRGTCADCGAPTYDRRSKRCRPCFLDSKASAAA